MENGKKKIKNKQKFGFILFLIVIIFSIIFIVPLSLGSGNWWNPDDWLNTTTSYDFFESGDTTANGTIHPANRSTLDVGGWTLTTGEANYSDMNPHNGNLSLIGVSSAVYYYDFNETGVSNGTLEFWMYDAGGGVDTYAYLSNGATRIMFIGLRQSQSTTNYVVYDYQATSYVTLNARTTDDWVRFNIHWGGDVMNFSVDGSLNNSGIPNLINDNISRIELELIETHFYDDIKIWLGVKVPSPVDYPIISLDNPANNAENGSLTINFLSTATDEDGINNCSLYQNESGSFVLSNNETGISSGVQFNITRDFSDYGVYNWSIYCCDTSGYCNLSDENRTLILAVASPTVTLDFPGNNSFNNTASLNFTCLADKGTNDLKNMTLYLNTTGSFVSNGTQTLTGSSDAAIFNITNIDDGSYKWNCLVYDTYNLSGWDNNRTFGIDTINPVVDVTSPTETNYTYSKTTNYLIEYVVSDSNLDGCYYILDANGTNVSLSGCGNITEPFGGGSHSLAVYANDSADNIGNGTTSFYINYINWTDTGVNNATETQEINFSLTIETTNSSSSKNATFWFNNTAYNYSVKDVNGNITTFAREITVPTISNNSVDIDSYWNYTVDIINNVTATRNPTIYSFVIAACSGDNATYFTAINFSLKDEMNDSLVEGDLDIDFVYWLSGNNLLNKSFDYDEDFVYSNYTFCISPENSTLYTNYQADSSATDYPQRRLYKNDVVITKTMSSQDLYLLKTADGMYVRFQTVDKYQNGISDVRVLMEKSINSVYKSIEQSDTDDSGLVTFWVNPDDDYRFTFTKTGYEQVIKTLRPTSTEIYYIVMGEDEEEEEAASLTGIIYSFYPKYDVLNNDSWYNFTFNLTSSYWSTSSCVFWLTNKTDETLNQTTSPDCSTFGANYTLQYNTGNLTHIIAKANFTINNTASGVVTVRRDYSIRHIYEGEFSLKNFFDDVKDFAMAGFDDFSRALIGMFIILSITGLAGYYSGVQNPEGILLILLSATWFFSVLGWFTMESVTGMPSTWLQQYMIAIVISLFVGGFIVWRHQ